MNDLVTNQCSYNIYKCMHIYIHTHIQCNKMKKKYLLEHKPLFEMYVYVYIHTSTSIEFIVHAYEHNHVHTHNHKVPSVGISKCNSKSGCTHVCILLACICMNICMERSVYSSLKLSGKKLIFHNLETLENFLCQISHN